MGSVASSTTKDALTKNARAAHEGYDLYPCFLQRRGNDNVVRIGAYQDLLNHLDRLDTNEIKDERFVLICLASGKCNPCDTAKRNLLKLFEQKKLKPDQFVILQRDGTAFSWRATMFEKEADHNNTKKTRSWTVEF